MKKTVAQTLLLDIQGGRGLENLQFDVQADS